jgi:hypothetical protein
MGQGREGIHKEEHRIHLLHGNQGGDLRITPV